MTEIQEKTIEKKVVRKQRWLWNLVQVLLGIPAMLMAFWYSPALMRVFDREASSLSIQVLQAFLVAAIGVGLFAALAHLYALFNERQFKENSWEGKSRYGVLYLHYFWAGVILSAFLLGALGALQR